MHQLFQKSDTREVSSGNYSFWDSFKPAGAQTRNLQGKQSVRRAAQRDVFAGGWFLKSDDIVFPLSLAAKCKPLSKSSQKMDKTQLDSFDIAKNANDWKRRGCRFSIHWQRRTVVNFSNRLIWKPRWSFWGNWVGTLVGGIWWRGQWRRPFAIGRLKCCCNVMIGGNKLLDENNQLLLFFFQASWCFYLDDQLTDTDIVCHGWTWMRKFNIASVASKIAMSFLLIRRSAIIHLDQHVLNQAFIEKTVFTLSSFPSDQSFVQIWQYDNNPHQILFHINHF